MLMLSTLQTARQQLTEEMRRLQRTTFQPPKTDSVIGGVPVDSEYIIFIIDTSGSMHGASISQAKRAVYLAIQALEPGDLFNVIEFNSYTTALYSHSVPASAGNVAKALSCAREATLRDSTE